MTVDHRPYLDVYPLAAVDSRRFCCRNYGRFICRNDVGAGVKPTALFWRIRCLNAVARHRAAVQVGRLGKLSDGGKEMHKAGRHRLFDSGLGLSTADEGGNVCWVASPQSSKGQFRWHMSFLHRCSVLGQAVLAHSSKYRLCMVYTSKNDSREFVYMTCTIYFRISILIG